MYRPPSVPDQVYHPQHSTPAATTTVTPSVNTNSLEDNSKSLTTKVGSSSRPIERFPPHHVAAAQHRKIENFEEDPHAYRLAENPYHGDVHPVSPIHRLKLNKWYQKHKNHPTMSQSLTDNSDDAGTATIDDVPTYDGTGTYAGDTTYGMPSGTFEEADTFDQTIETYDTYDPSIVEAKDNRRTKKWTRDVQQSEDDYLRTKQPVAYVAILITSVQLLILMLQLTMCGLAPLDVNGFVGPYPDAFSDWGGKNSYLMLRENQWWRLITPSFLHVGIFHLLVNAFCQLEAIALFEREWGSFRWILIYLIGSIGCSAFSSFFDMDNIAVGSSGAVMGLYGAKLAQIFTLAVFDLKKNKYDDWGQMDQLSSVLCGMTIIFLLTAFSYIDWSGHMGGFSSGFLAGVVLFSNPIASCCSRFFWVAFGFLGLIGSIGAVLYYFVTIGDPDPDIGDACSYFRSFFPEDYDCNCLWS